MEKGKKPSNQLKIASMRILLLVVIMLSCSLSAQSIFKGLEHGMSKDEAVSEFRANKSDYINIEIGNGFAYRIYQQNFEYTNDGLVSVLLTPKGSAMGQGYYEAVDWLDYSKTFFDKLDYREFFVPEYWNAPLNFRSKYGLLMYNSEKTVMLQLFPIHYTIGNSKSYLVKLQLYNYDQFMEWYNAEKDVQREITEKSGF
jgi:hypothetical protein